MKRFRNYITFAIIIAAVFEGCKKYPDGPVLSIFTKQQRVVNKWKVDYFSINDYDSTNYLLSKPYIGSYIFSKEKEGHADFTYLSDDHHYGAGGEWEFKDDKSELHIYCHSDTPGVHFSVGAFAADNATWQIMRLTENEMWLKTNFTDGRTYFVKFKTKKD